MVAEPLSITVDYILDTGEQHTFALSPEEYFDMDDTSEVASLDIDSTPRHQEVRQYLPAGTSARQARVRVKNTRTGDLWEVIESYWQGFGDDCISVTAKESRHGIGDAWKKYIHIRSSDGRDRVITLVQGEGFPILESILIVDNDEYRCTAMSEQDGLFRNPTHVGGRHPSAWRPPPPTTPSKPPNT